MRRIHTEQLPKPPQKLEDDSITDEWSRTLRGGQFLLHQERSMAIFAAEEGLRFLSNSKYILADGTFKTAPHPFHQIYIIHGSAGDFVVPVVWAFLDGKSEELYTKFFKILSDKICQNFQNFLPEFILTDFETAVIPTIRSVFPYSTHLGCNFHFSQCLYRKIQELGLVQRYKADEVFKLIIHKVFSMPFLPENEVRNAFITYQLQLKNYLDENPQIQAFFDYFWNFWFFGINLTLWNVYGRELRFRTNNWCESFNASWKKDAGAHSTFYTILQLLQIY